jgi:hypothetical protein
MSKKVKANNMYQFFSNLHFETNNLTTNFNAGSQDPNLPAKPV